MRQAIRSWQGANASLNTAVCRFRLAQILAQDADVAGALLELDLAETAFDALEAPLRARACADLRRGLAAEVSD